MGWPDAQGRPSDLGPGGWPAERSAAGGSKTRGISGNAGVRAALGDEVTEEGVFHAVREGYAVKPGGRLGTICSDVDAAKAQGPSVLGRMVGRRSG
jgi:hypothetical protein